MAVLEKLSVERAAARRGDARYEREPAVFEARPDGLARGERLTAMPRDRGLEDVLESHGGVTARVWITPRIPGPGLEEQRLERCF